MTEPIRKLWARRRWAAYAALVALCVLAALLFEALPRAQRCLALWSEWEAKRARVASRAASAGSIDRLEGRLSELKGRYASEALRLPGSGEMSVTLAALQEAAASNTVRIMEMRPGALRKQSTHSARPVEVRLRGTFREITSFLNAIEQGPHLMKLRGVWISRTTSSEPGDAAGNGSGEEKGGAPTLEARAAVRVVSAAERGAWQRLFPQSREESRPDSLQGPGSLREPDSLEASSRRR